MSILEKPKKYDNLNKYINDCKDALANPLVRENANMVHTIIKNMLIAKTMLHAKKLVGRYYK